VGTAEAVSNNNAYYSGVAAGSAASSASAYNAGVATGEAAAPVNHVYTTLPANCLYKPVGTVNYFQCGAMWLEPAFGANGLYYRVVPAP
jgi:hypothetical protein